MAGTKYNEGKTRHDLKPAFAEEQYAKVLTFGANKYSAYNWAEGIKWSAIIASLERHLIAIKRGEDYDSETGLLHASHCMCNAAFLTEYYKIFPQGDDRFKPLLNRKIGLDIDGVLADFNQSFIEYIGTANEPNHWYYDYKAVDSKLWDILKDDLDFWLNLKSYSLGQDLPFEPVVYVTSRPIPSEVSMKWIESNHFPCSPVETVNGNKVEILKKYDIDIFVDDKYSNFLELNEAGICTYLLDRPWNRKFDVGHLRIYDLKELIEYK